MRQINNPLLLENEGLRTTAATLSSYEVALGELILKSRTARGVGPFERNEELAAQARAFGEICEGEIPLKDLNAAYVRAMQDKSSDFPLSATELVNSYRANCESERVTPEVPQDKNLLAGEVCSRCYGSGMEQTVVHGYTIARRCDHKIITEQDLEEAGF